MTAYRCEALSLLCMVLLGCSAPKANEEIAQTGPQSSSEGGDDVDPATTGSSSGSSGSDDTAGTVDPQACECTDPACAEPLCPMIHYNNLCHGSGLGGTTGDFGGTTAGSGGFGTGTGTGSETGGDECADAELAVEALDCALQAIANGAPGQINYSWIEDYGVYSGNATLTLLGGGEGVVSSMETEDLCWETSPSVVRGSLAAAAGIEECRALPDFEDRWLCLRGAVDATTVCAEAEFQCDG